VGRERRRQRTSGLLSDGAPGLQLRAHGGPGVNDAGGWTLHPGKDGRQSFYSSFCGAIIDFCLCSPVPGTALGECPVAQYKMSRSYMDVIVNGGVFSSWRN